MTSLDTIVWQYFLAHWLVMIESSQNVILGDAEAPWALARLREACKLKLSLSDDVGVHTATEIMQAAQGLSKLEILVRSSFFSSLCMAVCSSVT